MIPFLDLTRQHRALHAELLAALGRVVDSAHFVLGPEGRALEAELAAACGVRHGVGVGSGTDALRLALAAVGVRPGDEVVTPAFSFVASASTIVMAGARPVFVDVDPDTCALDPAAFADAITPRTRAVVVVHLYGHPAPIDAVSGMTGAKPRLRQSASASATPGLWPAAPSSMVLSLTATAARDIAIASGSPTPCARPRTMR